MNGGIPSPRTSISPAALHDLKTFWGVIFAVGFLFLVWLFVKGVFRARDIKYNWLKVLLSFLAVGLALYLIFFIQF